MKNREPKRYPTSEELYALERAAKAARTAEMVRLVAAAVSRVKSLFAATEQTKGLKHA